MVVGQDKTDKEVVSWEKLIQLSNKALQDNSCFKEGKFLAWQKITKEEEKMLTILGLLVNDKGKQDDNPNKYHPEGTKYYSKEAPIALAYYPYNGCDVFQCSKSGKLYLIYTEHGGHKPERRCRLVQPQLIHK